MRHGQRNLMNAMGMKKEVYYEAEEKIQSECREVFCGLKATPEHCHYFQKKIREIMQK